MKRKLTKKQSKKAIFLRQFSTKKAHKAVFKVYGIRVEVRFLSDWKSNTDFCMYDDKGLTKQAERSLCRQVAEYMNYNKLVDVAI